jgi:hypothetical protein
VNHPVYSICILIIYAFIYGFQIHIRVWISLTHNLMLFSLNEIKNVTKKENHEKSHFDATSLFACISYMIFSLSIYI